MAKRTAARATDDEFFEALEHRYPWGFETTRRETELLLRMRELRPGVRKALLDLIFHPQLGRRLKQLRLVRA